MSESLGACDSMQKKALFIDLYRRPFLFMMPDKVPSYRTLLGSMLSIFTLVLILSYATFKFV